MNAKHALLGNLLFHLFAPCAAAGDLPGNLLMNGSFDKTIDSWIQFQQSFNFFWTATDVADDPTSGSAVYGISVESPPSPDMLLTNAPSFRPHRRRTILALRLEGTPETSRRPVPQRESFGTTTTFALLNMAFRKFQGRSDRTGPEWRQRPSCLRTLLGARRF